LLPDAPVLVLSRSPLGVASSFERGGLFRRWGYGARYQQMIKMTREGGSAARRYRPLVPDDGPPDLMALVRLQVLNTLLLADALTGLNVTHIPYETAVIAPGVALGILTAAVPELADQDLCLGQAPHAPAGPSSGEDTFSTATAKTGLVAHLDPANAELIRATTAASLAAAQAVTPPLVAAQAATWLAGDHLYRLEPLRPRPAAARPFQPWPTRAVTPRYVRRGGLEVRNLLVSNTEYARFLNALAQAGMPNSHSGTYLLACEMPHERGGRLHHDPATGRSQVSPGYEDHPVYWVTWIGAAAFAAWHGARLPARTELIELTSHASGAAGNTAYRSGDVTPVTEPGRRAGEVHHLLGNLQVWCADGPTAGHFPCGPAARWLYGAAWNTPATAEEVGRPRHRHILGCSRGVGIRLVRDGAQHPVGIGELAARLTAWIAILADRSRPLAELDQWLIRALDASQADAGLRPHVAPGAGETGHG
jgi:formylglycine-generating enzyme required for sulfatase activity